MKECLACGFELDVLEFYDTRDGDDSYQVLCRGCRAEDPELAAEYRRKIDEAP